MNKKYTVQLDSQQRQMLESMLKGGKASARSLTHARIVLKADQGEGGPGWTDEQIVEALSVGRATVERVRKRFVDGSAGRCACSPTSWSKWDMSIRSATRRCG